MQTNLHWSNVNTALESNLARALHLMGTLSQELDQESSAMAEKTVLGIYLEGLTRQLNGKSLHVQPVSGESFVLTSARTEQDGKILSGTMSTINTHSIIPISQIVHVWYNPEDLKSS